MLAKAPDGWGGWLVISTDDFRLLVLLSIFHSNHENRPLDCSGNFFLFLRDLFTIFSMVSAADQNRRDLRDFSAFGNDP